MADKTVRPWLYRREEGEEGAEGADMGDSADTAGGMAARRGVVRLVEGYLKREAAAGNLRYLDKKRYSEAQRMSGLQLPRAFELRSKKKVLTEKDIVKPGTPLRLALKPAPDIKGGVPGKDSDSDGFWKTARELRRKRLLKPNAADHAAGVLQALPDEPGTESVFESTANGLGNYFHEGWSLAFGV